MSICNIHHVSATPAYPMGAYVFDKTDVISNYVISGKEWEPHICELMAKYYKPGTDVVDIGANLGLNSVGLHRRNPITGTLHLFEPQPDVFSLMAVNTRHIPRRLYNMCLSSKPAVLRFEQNPSNIGGTHMIGDGGLTDDPDPTGKNAVSVAAFPLDMVDLALSPTTSISLIKIDVEGAEEAVLEGARETIMKHTPVIFIEVWPWKRDGTFAKLAAFGYERMQHIGGDDFIVFPK